MSRRTEKRRYGKYNKNLMSSMRILEKIHMAFREGLDQE